MIEEPRGGGVEGGGFLIDLHLFGVKNITSLLSVYSVPVFIFCLFFKEIISALKPGKRGAVGGGSGLAHLWEMNCKKYCLFCVSTAASKIPSADKSRQHIYIF